MKKPLVSILIPVFNRREILAETLDSAITQSYSDIEIIVVDNCSSDGTWEILKKYAQNDNRIRIFRNSENIGPVRNWMRCVEYAEGVYGKFLWSDDLIKSNFLEKTLPYLDNPEVAFAFTGTIVFDKASGGENHIFKIGQTGIFPVQDYILGVLLGSDYPVSPGCALFRLSDIRKNLLLEIPNSINAVFSQLAIGNDLLLFLLTANEYSKFAYVKDILSLFRSHPGSISYINKEYTLGLYYNISKAFFIERYRPDLIPKFNVILLAFLVKNISVKNKLVKRVRGFYPSQLSSNICWHFLFKKILHKFFLINII